MRKIDLLVNGARCTVEAQESTPLLYILRNDLGLVATRFGCGLGQCGACNVLLDGNVVTSCDTPVWAAEGKSVVTVEGLGSAQAPHPVQRAILEEQAGQCGYCLSGIIISAAALLQRDPRPTREAICAALDRNLCRCGAHNRVIRAIERAAAQP